MVVFPFFVEVLSPAPAMGRVDASLDGVTAAYARGSN